MVGASHPDIDSPSFPSSCAPVERHAAFDRFGGRSGSVSSPIVISVPHAGREYPAPLLAQARVPAITLRRLEDRYSDLLAHGLIDLGHEVLIARTARAVIDLNRDEREIDPVMLRDAPHGTALLSTAKLRGGLGLFPRRLQGANELWRGPMDWSEAQCRIAQVHRPYHDALAAMMARARDVHGYAILIDLHSMPPLHATPGQDTPHIVLGDRFGRSASSRLTARAADVMQARGIRVAQNHPYPGNYLIDRHGRPDRGLHAVQIEIDRSLYLDSALDRPTAGVAAMQALLIDLAQALADEWPATDFAQAAE
tara:strand:- start:877 stop:1806 length:930 start_codon:yes stop_codon:yes gene_type:complete